MFVFGSDLALVRREVVAPAHCSEGALIESLGESAVSQQNLRLFPIDLRVEIHSERYNANNVKDKIRGVGFELKSVAAGSLLFHELNKCLRFVQNHINQTKQMARLEARSYPFV